MKKTDAAVQIFIPSIKNKKILEVACGDAEFSISASCYAHQVSCIDLDDSRICSVTPDNVHFEIMDAAKMRFSSESFDSVFLYHALSHIQSQWESIQQECMRVLKPEGCIYIVGTWKMDIALIHNMFHDEAEWNNGFLVVKIIKNYYEPK